MNNEIEQAYTLECARNVLNISRPTFFKLLKSGKIKGFRVGRTWRFTRDELRRFMLEHAEVLQKKC